MSFVHAEKAMMKGDAVKLKQLHDAEVRVIHYFSLLHAIALTSLPNSAGQLYGKLSENGGLMFQRWHYIPYPGSKITEHGEQFTEYPGSMQDWSHALEERVMARVKGLPRSLIVVVAGWF